MLRFLLLSLFYIFGFTAAAQGKITVRITGLNSNKGVCRACIFSNAAAFAGKGQPVQCTESAVRNKEAQVAFENIPAGAYAISVFHDANNNNQLDKNFLGIPKEGYGASQNKLPFASAPTFEANKFTVAEKGDMHLNIKVRNL